MKPNIVQSPEIWHRDDFPLLCNWRKLWRAVEVGVDRGEFALMFLNRWLGHEFFGIDPYLPVPGMPYSRQSDLIVASTRFERHACKARLIVAGSEEVAAIFPQLQDRCNETTDFVYLDGDHSLDGVRRDIAAWWSRISPEGILAGHDFDETHPGVMQAVTEFSASQRVTVYTTDEDECKSWYCYKRGLPGPDWVRNTGDE